MEIANLLSSIFWTLAELGSLFVCLASLAGFLGRRSWFLELFSHFRVQYLVLLAFATIVFVAGGRFPQAIASGLFAFVNILLVAPLYVKSPVHESSNPGLTGQDAYRVLLANVLQTNAAFGSIRHLIRTEQPDFIILIEVNKTWIDQLKSVLDAYPFSRMPLREDNYGIALFSRFPPTFSEVRHFGAAQVPSIITTFNLQQQRVSILATHPPPPKTKQAAGLRNIQLAEIAEYIHTLQGEALLVGDLNMTSWSPHFSDLIQNSRLRDSRKGFGMQNTWPTNRRLLQIPIDHILVSKGVVVLSRRIGQFNGSDHYPVLLDFSLAERVENTTTKNASPEEHLLPKQG